MFVLKKDKNVPILLLLLMLTYLGIVYSRLKLVLILKVTNLWGITKCLLCDAKKTLKECSEIPSIVAILRENYIYKIIFTVVATSYITINIYCCFEFILVQ